MRKSKRATMDELIKENIDQLMSDPYAITEIENRIEEKNQKKMSQHLKKAANE